MCNILKHDFVVSRIVLLLSGVNRTNWVQHHSIEKALAYFPHYGLIRCLCAHHQQLTLNFVKIERFE